MKILLVVTVISGFLAHSLAFKLGEDEEHNHHQQHSHEINHEHKHAHEHHESEKAHERRDKNLHFHEKLDNEQARKGKNENLSSDETNDARDAKFAVDFSRAAPVELDDGTLKNCVEKEEFMEELKKDPVLECLHKSVEKCHYTYMTIFVPIQEEVCDDIFIKHCNIHYKKVVMNETFLQCYNPLVRECSVPETGEETCREYFESSCTTRYVEKAPGKFVADTSCEKLPISLCGDMSCRMVPGPQECHNKTTASLMDQPEEHCDLFPQKMCRHKTTLVPRLKPEQECTTVPKEICNIKYVNPRIEKVPFKTLWCQDEEDEIDTFVDAKPNVDELPAYEPEKPTELPNLPGYDYPVPSNPLQLQTASEPPPEDENNFPDDIFSDLFELPAVDIDIPQIQEPVTRPTVSSTTRRPSTTRQPVPVPTTQPLKTVKLTPEDLQAAVAKAIRQAVANSVSKALQIQEATHNSQQSLKLVIQAAVEEAVRRAVINSVQSQSASRRPQSSRGLKQAVQAAVRQAVESSVEQILRASGKTGEVMTAGMKRELNVMRTLIQQAVLQAMRAALNSAINTADTQVTAAP